MKSKLVSAEGAVALVHDGDTICCNGFVQSGIPDGKLQILHEGKARNLVKKVNQVSFLISGN